MQDITIRHPQYDAFAESWRQVRDANAGEDDIKQAGERYLPMKSGQAAIKDPAKRAAAYNAYKTRAEFPEVVAPTIRGAVGVMLSKPATIDLPPQMEHLRERATLDGLTLDALHRRIAMEVMATGRYGLLPGLHDGVPYLSGYVAESIINWDSTAGALDFLVLDESGPVRDRATGQWSEVDRYRECLLDGRVFIARVWTKGSSGWSTEEEPRALTPRKTALDSLPFVFIGSLDLTPAPDDVPLYGLAKLAVRAYRVDADRMAAIHLTCEGTPWVNGFNDAAQAQKEERLPSGLGASALWVLPEGATAGALEFSASGVQPAKDAFDDALERAAQFGAQIIQQGSAAESGEALKLRAASQTATLATAAFSVGAYVKLADSWSDMQSVVGAATKDMDGAGETMRRLADLAAASYSPLEQTARGFAANATILKELGYNTQQMLDYTEALNHALVINAAKGENAAVVQNALGRALATGKLQATEYEVIMSRSPRVLEAIAKEMGTTVASLRQLGSEGKITGEIIGRALTGELVNLREEAGNMPATVGDAFTLIGNSFLELVGVFDQTGQISAGLADRLVDLSKWIRSLADIDFAAWADTATAALTLMGQAVLVLAATRIPALLLSLQSWMVAQGLTTASSIAGAAASRAMAGAMAVQAGAARALGAAMSFVGGPIGIAFAAATALALSLWNVASRSQDAQKALEKARVAQDALSDAATKYYENMTSEGLAAMVKRAEAFGKAQADALIASIPVGWLNTTQDGMRQLFETTNDTARNLLWMVDQLKEAKGIDAQAEAGQRLLDRIVSITGGIESMSIGQLDFYEKVKSTLDELNKVREAQASATEAAVTGVAQLTAEQQKALAAAQELERSYQQRIQLAQAEQQYGKDSAQYMQVQLQYERAIQHAKIDALDISQRQKAELKAQYDEMVRLEAKTQGWNVTIGKVNGPLSSAYDWLVKIRDTQPGDSWLSTAISRATDLAAKLLEAVGYTNILAEKASPQNTGSTDWYKDGNGLALSHLYMPSGVKGSAGGSGGGGGGGGGTSDRQSGLDSLIQEFASQREVIDAWYTEKYELIQSYTDMELEALGYKQGAIERLEAEHKQRLKDLNDQHRQMELEAQRSMYGELGNLLGIFSGKSRLAAIAQIGINTALRLAETAQNTAAASMRALAELGPIAGPPAAAKIAAYGKVQMGLIAAAGVAQGLGAGRGTSGSGGGAAGASNTVGQGAQSAPVAVTIQGLDPDSFYSGRQVISMTDAVQKEFKRRGVVLTFTS